MTSSSTRRQCSNNDGCKKPAAIRCEGCLHRFCHMHFIDHQSLLNRFMDATIRDHDLLQQTLREQGTDSNQHPLIRDIDEWEQQFITNIRKKAEELREQLSQLISLHRDELSEKLEYLKVELRENCEHKSFVETDLQGWRRSLDDLRAKLNAPSMFSISGFSRPPPTPNVFVNFFEKNELFERVSKDKVRIDGHGQVAIHDVSTTEIEIRGKNEYVSGRHEIRLRIEECADKNSWMFLGVNSKSTPLQNNSYASGSACGWATNNILWLNGQPTSNVLTGIEMKTNDTIILIIDCQNRKVLMINERTNAHYELDVNVDRCPYPWQLHVNLYDANSSIRILSV